MQFAHRCAPGKATNCADDLVLQAM